MDKHTQEVLLKLNGMAGADHILLNEPMKYHTTMKVGGPADLFITPSGIREIAGVVNMLRKEKIPYFILGNGSNVICRDQGYRGAVICLSRFYKGYRILQQEAGKVLVSVKAGTDNKKFSDACIRKGLSGFEFASGIPGSIGGAAAMNAGAYDGEMKQIVREVKLLDPEGAVVTKTGEEMEFGYRHSLVTGKDYVILEVVLELKEDDPEEIRKRVDVLTGKREARQPLEYPSCGSTFKRPEGYFAGKLISDAGLKGFQLGGAQVSEKHAGFVINRDDASAEDILNLIEHIRQTVYEQSGVKLECEVKMLG